MVLVVHIPESSYHLANHTRAQVEVLFELASAQKESRFIFFTGKLSGADFPALPNLGVREAKPAIRNRLLQYFWYQFTLPKILAKEKATHFLSLQPVEVSLKGIRHCTWLTDFSLFSSSGSERVSGRIRESLKQVDTIIVPGSATAEMLEQKFSVKGKLSRLSPPVLLGIQQREDYINMESGYFTVPVCSADMHRLRILLKAFTLFKKRQRSGMFLQLITPQSLEEQVNGVLAAYKLRSHITVRSVQKWVEAQPQFSAGYANLYLPEKPAMDDLTEQLILAGKSLICIDHPLWKDIFLEAAVYTPLHEEMISLQMMNLYKNESRKMARDQHLTTICSERSVSGIVLGLQAALSANSM